MAATKTHADASPSSSSIWINCPASVTKARGRQRKATVYTLEGSAAHHAAELILNGLDVPVLMEIDGVEVTVTEEMLDNAQIYVDYVNDLHGLKLIETKVHVDVQGEPLYGTADAIVVAGRKAEIVDFKYGQGVAVDPDSSQLKIYALGMLEHVGPFAEVDEVTMTIVQPRGGGIKSMTVPVKALSEWEKDTLVPAVGRIAAGDTTETPGEHCRWCVRAGECAALANLAMTSAKVAFGDLPPEPAEMTNQDLAEILEYGEMIVAWVGKVRAEVSGRIDNGQAVPGWKLVPKRASRKWAYPQDAIEKMDRLGVPRSEITRIETIGAVEKVVKKRKLDPEAVIYPYTIKIFRNDPRK